MSFKWALKRIEESPLVLRLKEVKHRLTYEKSDRHMIRAMERFEKCDKKKPRSQIRKEIQVCKKFWRCYPLHYYRYDLYRKDKKLYQRDLINYIPEFFFYRLFLPFYDSGQYTLFLKEKTITEQFFRSLDIKQPHTICKLINNRFFTNELKEKAFTNIQEELIEREYQKIFVKPANGYGGFGIYVFNRKNKGHYETKNREVFNENFLKVVGVTNQYIIQSGLEQDQDISKIYSHSINTFRIATEHLNGNVRILCATLRIGWGGMQVDNGTQGGILIKVDIENGHLSDHATTEEGGCFKEHPDTNFVFKETQISQWDKVKEFVVESAKKLHQFTYLGWDVALTPNGPVAIEANLNFGLDHFQVALGGLREIFNISDPKFYWKNWTKIT